MIRKILYILPLLFLLLFNGQKETTQESIISSAREVILTEAGKADLLNVQLNTDEAFQLQSVGLCFTSRVQISPERGERTSEIASRQLESLLQKEQSILNKISETLLITHSLKFSSLRIRSGHWVYVLRKIII